MEGIHSKDLTSKSKCKSFRVGGRVPKRKPKKLGKPPKGKT
jgi:hypothetical protein